MRKTLILFLIGVMLLQLVPVSANEYTSEWVNVDFYVAPSINFIKTDAVFELYNMNDELLTSDTFTITKTGCVYNLKFHVPQYPIGTQFKLKLVKGFVNMQHYDSIVGEGLCVVLSTYSFIPEGATEVVIGDYFGVNCSPYPEQNMSVYVNGKSAPNNFYLKRDNGDILAEVSDLMKFFMISQYDYRIENDKIEINHNGNNIIFTLGSGEVSVNGEMRSWHTVPQYLEGSLYLSVGMMAQILEADYSAEDIDEQKKININLKSSKPLEERMNAEGLSSKTDHLIWVNKGTYTVEIFSGTQGDWHHIKSFKCAIGAPQTPTITGTFTYYQWQKVWNYPEYYVGPIMRFYGKGYAIHSTKVKYDGTDYDGRTGMKLSLGCVRVRPEEMKWMASTIPLHTTIHITEN